MAQFETRAYHSLAVIKFILTIGTLRSVHSCLGHWGERATARRVGRVVAASFIGDLVKVVVAGIEGLHCLGSSFFCLRSKREKARS
ncbi:hypothetical protein CRG98_039183 [Punica granatum]|uniref:Uncharacterized protein n=1 Tax=Punica granatum TaxID=22663 RepID=A0A2I0I8V6_PUNGR|nr:hypothetical protein CRG98_039183 [Punica granatum]